MPAAAPVKSFMTAGPTLHYSHTNVLWFWGLSIVVFLFACYFWTLLMPVSPELHQPVSTLANPDNLYKLLVFPLGDITIKPISIYEYPLQIIVLGILMGILAIFPVLISQLLSFRFSIPLVLCIMFIAKLYLFGVFVLISCIAVACRPLRFRSRFISIALCMAPQLVYWAVWGDYSTADPVRWGFSFAPWIYAWLSGLTMAAIVLGVGHFTRYKPGLNWVTCLLFLGIALFIFQQFIGFAELDYHRYIAGNNPEDVVEFHEQSITGTIDLVIEDNVLRSRLEGQFYPTEPGKLRQKLGEEIQVLLGLPNPHWPEWFRRKMPEELKYQYKRQRLLMEYDKFIQRWPNNEKRMPIALYYKAILSEFHPDVRQIADRGLLRFYSDYPFPDNILKWQELYDDYSLSLESIEARWRLAMDLGRRKKFDTAANYCQVALDMIKEHKKAEQEKESAKKSDSIFAVFQKPSETVMTPFKLDDLKLRLKKLETLISDQNRGPDEESAARLSEFVMLNPHEMNYVARLDGLLEDIKDEQGDPLCDNILLEKAKQADDIERREALLEELLKQYPNRDTRIEAQYELALAKIQLWRQPELPETQKQKYLDHSRRILSALADLGDECPFAQQARSTLQTLPVEKEETE